MWCSLRHSGAAKQWACCVQSSIFSMGLQPLTHKPLSPWGRCPVLSAWTSTPVCNLLPPLACSPPLLAFFINFPLLSYTFMTCQYSFPAEHFQTMDLCALSERFKTWDIVLYHIMTRLMWYSWFCLSSENSCVYIEVKWHAGGLCWLI